MKAIIVFFVSILMMLTVPSFATEYQPGNQIPEITLEEIFSTPKRSTLAQDQDIPVNSSYCKVCRKGKARGDSCISRTYVCTKTQGSAYRWVNSVRQITELFHDD